MNEREPEATNPRADCSGCRHYYVTWDERFPHGCRAFGFKADRKPSWVVRESSGMRCQAHRAKPLRRAEG